MKKESGFFKSSDEKNNIYYVIWEPDDCEPVAVLQIAHGMVEHIERYKEFARFLTSHKIAVIGNDMLGHGNTVARKEDFGFFAYKNGNKFLLSDAYTMHTIGLRKFPHSKHFLLGHSMGSFIVRQFLYTYPHSDLYGALIIGTAHDSLNFLRLARLLADSYCKTFGSRYRSKFMCASTLGKKSKIFRKENSIFASMTTDIQERESLKNDKFCKFLFTAAGYRDMLDGILNLYLPKNLSRINKKIPILISSGSMDPIGSFGIEPERVYKQYKKLGVENVTLKLWRGLRHDIIHEKNKEDVYKYIYSWVNDCMKNKEKK